MTQMRFRKRRINWLLSDFIYILGVVFISLGICGVVGLDVDRKQLKTENENLTKVVSKSTMLSSYKEIDDFLSQPVFYNSFEQAVLNSKKGDTSFVGKLVHYGPDCAECSGHLGCNGQDARGGNIYYNDKEYGKVRIVAASSLLPCGSIIRINVNAYDSNGLYAIVLDRGVSGNMIDLLKASQRDKSPVRTANGVKFDILRYGY